MKIVVINGTEKHGVTYRLKEAFLEDFRKKSDTEITEFYLPKDCPSFCSGCTNCFMTEETKCKDAEYIQPAAKALLEADLIVMTSPVYVYHATGAMKAFLDHLGYQWMPHRPAEEMFSKRAIIITQSLGAGTKTTAADMKHSLSWWGVSYIKVFSDRLMSDVFWDKIPEKKRKSLIDGVKSLSEKFSKIDYSKPAAVSMGTKIKFMMCRMIQLSVHKEAPSADSRYWESKGWLGNDRPWKR